MTTTSKQFIEAEQGLIYYMGSDQYVMIAHYAEACYNAKAQLEKDVCLSVIRKCRANGAYTR